MHRLRASLSIVQRRKPGHGMNFSRAPRKAAATVDRRFEIVCHGSTTPGQWVSMSFIFHPFTRLGIQIRSEEHTSELQSRVDLVCRLLLEKKNSKKRNGH